MSQMTDKEKIRKEVKRLMTELIQEKKKGYSSDVDDACILELQNVLTFIDSLPGEKKPIREYVSQENSTLGKLYKEAMEELEEKIALYEKNHKKSVSNDLEEAAKIYTVSLVVNEIIPDATVKQLREVADKSFKAGAQWQKEQMMKDAVEREVKVDAGGYPYIDATELYDYDEDKPLAKEGDKVKLLIIKEE